MERLRHWWGWLQNPFHLAMLAGSFVPLYHAFLFIRTYNRNVPLADQWRFSIHIATAAKNGTLDLADLTASFNGHRFFFTNLLTALFSVVTGWQIDQEMWVNLLLAVINFVLVVIIFYHQQPAALAYSLIPFSALIFFLYQDENWIIASQNQWHFSLLFLFAPLAVLVSQRPSWRPLLLAIFLTICGAFSLATGILTWALLPVVMGLLGYRDWRHFLLWIVAAAITSYLYLHNLDQGVEGDEGWAALALPDLPRLIEYVINYLGVPFGGKLDNAVPYGFVGLAATGLNLWMLRQHPRLIAPWLALIGYAVGSGLIIALGRLHVGFEEAHPRYNTHALLLWLALVALMLLNGDRSRRLLQFNVIVAVVLVGLYLRSNYAFLQIRYSTYAQPYGWERPALWGDESCVLNYPLTRDRTCYGATEQSDEAIYYLAAYRLAIFADQSAVNVLPETYQNGSPIIIHSPSRWLNVYVRDWMLRDINEDALFHIAPAENFVSTDTLPQPLNNDYLTYDEAVLQAFITAQAQVWLITTPETTEQTAPIIADLEAAGYVSTPYPIQTERYRLAQFSIYRFQQPPADTETIFSFGDENITLQAWSITQGDRVINSRGESRLAPTTDPIATITAETILEIAPCDSLRVQSWWQSEQVPRFNYSTTLVLLNDAGNVITQKDASIGDTLMQLWQPEQFYFDERLLTIPCEAEPGTYTLAFGLYNNTGSGFIDLTAVDADGQSLGSRAPITTLEVR